MKHTLLLLSFMLLHAARIFASHPSDKNLQNSELLQQVERWQKHSSFGFIPNRGQIADDKGNPVNDVLYMTSMPGVDLYITTTGMTYIFKKVEEERKVSSKDKKNKTPHKESKKTEWCRMDMNLVGSNIKRENSTTEYSQDKSYFNYYLPHCPDGILNVKTFSKITIKEIYPGIDWILYNDPDKGLKYDFIVHPGANLNDIQMLYKGAGKIEEKQDGKMLAIKTDLGEIEEGAIVSYEVESKKNIPSRYKVTNNKVHFETDKYNTQQTLVIDPPMQLIWGTYYGGSGLDGPRTIASDSTGNIYIAGYTSSGDLPLDSLGGAYYQGALGGMFNSFIIKFNSSGVRQWATFYGGDNDWTHDIATDKFGNVYLTGITYFQNTATNFPTQFLAGAYNQASNAGPQFTTDAFILKFNSAGVRQWSTCFGGSGMDIGKNITTDASGNLYLFGSTLSTDLPLQNPGSGAYFQPANGGLSDAFILKFAPSNALVWSTYYGGSDNDTDDSTNFGYPYDVGGIAVDVFGNIYIMGNTWSTDLPIQNLAGAYNQSTIAGVPMFDPITDAFIAKFNSSYNLVWATYFGGSNYDAPGQSWVNAYAIITDASGNLYVTGTTSSINFPTQNMPGSYFQGTKAGPPPPMLGAEDMFISMFNTADSLVWSTYYGGSDDDDASGITIDLYGNVYITGMTLSTDFPVQNPGGGAFFQGTIGGGGNFDAFLIQLNSSNNSLAWSTYYGAGDIDFGIEVVTIPSGCLYATGEVWSAGPATLNPGGGAYYQSVYNGSNDGFVLKFCSVLSVNTTSTNPLCNGQCTGTATATLIGGTSPYTYSWNTLPVQTMQTATGLCAGTYSVTVTDAFSSTATATVSITQPTAISLTTSVTATACGSSTGTATVNASGGTSPYIYLWNPTGQTTQTATGLSAATYTATVTDANGCTQTQTVTVTANNTLSVSTTSTQTGCTVNNGTATANPSNGTVPYTYIWSNSQTTQTATGLSAATYTVTVTDANGCTQTQTVNITQMPGPTASATAAPINIILGGSTTLIATGGGTYLWSPPDGLSCITCANPTATPTATTEYCVFVTDANGCTDSACITINVEILCGDVFVPNGFSPNSDGQNELECVLGNCIETLSFAIYDRWGEKVFETDNPKICWDGMYKGVPMNTATFVYSLEATLTNGEKINRKGNISLIR